MKTIKLGALLSLSIIMAHMVAMEKPRGVLPGGIPIPVPSMQVAQPALLPSSSVKENLLVEAVQKNLGTDHMTILILEGINPLEKDAQGKSFLDVATQKEIGGILFSLKRTIDDLKQKIMRFPGNIQEVEAKMPKEAPVLAFSILEGMDPLEKSGGSSLLDISDKQNIAQTFSYLKTVVEYLRSALVAATYPQGTQRMQARGGAVPGQAAALPLPPLPVSSGIPPAGVTQFEEVLPAGVPIPLPIKVKKHVMFRPEESIKEIQKIESRKAVKERQAQQTILNTLLNRLQFEKTEDVFHNPNAIDQWGNSALIHIADRAEADLDTLQSIYELLALGADRNFVNPINGNTPLLAALTGTPYRNWKAAPRMAAWLIDGGADTYAKRRNGETVDSLVRALPDSNVKTEILTLLEKKRSEKQEVK